MSFYEWDSPDNMHLEKNHEKMKKEIAVSEKRMDEEGEDLFSKFKGLSDKEIEYIKSYNGPSIDEIIEELEKAE